MRGRWQGCACLVPPCPEMLSQSLLSVLCQPDEWPVLGCAHHHPHRLAVSPTRSLPSSASGLVKAVRDVRGAELVLDITVSNCVPTVMGPEGALCLVPMDGKKASAAAAHKCVAMHTEWCWTDLRWWDSQS